MSEETELSESFQEEYSEEALDGSLVEKPQDRKENDRPKILNLPLSRIKQIIKMDPDVHIASAEAVFLITKSAELFIETLSKDAYSHTASAKKKTIQKRDVESAIANAESLVFLEGMLDS